MRVKKAREVKMMGAMMNSRSSSVWRRDDCDFYFVQSVSIAPGTWSSIHKHSNKLLRLQLYLCLWFVLAILGYAIHLH